MKYYVCERSQHAKKGVSGNSGPDVYVMLVGVPEGCAFDEYRTPLHRDRLRRKGFFLKWIGEGYSRYRGPKSSLGKAWERANDLMDSLDSQESNKSIDEVAFGDTGC